MAWTTIANSAVAAGAAATTALFTALRDNPIAIALGQASSPRIYGLAVSPDTKIAADGLVLTVSAANTYTLQADAGITRVIGTWTTTALTVTAVTLTNRGYTGSIRFRCSHTAPAGTSWLLVYKNGGLVNTFSNSGTSIVERTQDISVVPGDIVRWDHYSSGAGSSSVISAASETANDAYLRLGALTRRSDL